MTRQEWLAWRKEGIGGSDVAAILGISPWQTIEQLLAEKISPVIKDIPPNFAQERGIRMEPRIRSLFEVLDGRTFEPALCIGAFPYLRVSLDGWHKESNTIIEIKVSGKEDWMRAKNQGMVPKKYYPQIQHALAITKAQSCLFLSYLWTQKEELVLDREKLVVITVNPDPAFQQEMFLKCEPFWKAVELGRRGTLVQGPNDPIEQQNVQKITEWKYLEMQIKALSARQDQLKEEIVSFVKSQSIQGAVCNGVKILPIKRKGNVNYKSIPELQNVDLEQYRGNDVEYWKMEIMK